MLALADSHRKGTVTHEKFLKDMMTIHLAMQHDIGNTESLVRELETKKPDRRRVITNPIDEIETRYQTKSGDTLIVLAKRESVVDLAVKELDTSKLSLKSFAENMRYTKKNKAITKEKPVK